MPPVMAVTDRNEGLLLSSQRATHGSSLDGTPPIVAPLARTYKSWASLITLSAWYDPQLVAACAAWGNCIAKHASLPTKNGMGRHASFQKQIFLGSSIFRPTIPQNQLLRCCN